MVRFGMVRGNVAHFENDLLPKCATFAELAEIQAPRRFYGPQPEYFCCSDEQ